MIQEEVVDVDGLFGSDSSTTSDVINVDGIAKRPVSLKSARTRREERRLAERTAADMSNTNSGKK